MTNVNILLPEPLRQFVEQQVSQGRYADAGDYIRTLIQARASQASLESQLLEGLDSGEATPMTANDWVDIRRAVCEQISP